MKICCNCKIEKDNKDFGKYARSKDGLHPRCRECKRKYDATYYKTNYLTRLRIAEANTESRIRNRKFILDYLLTHPCIDCKENDPVVLEFDHRHSKRCNVSALINSYSLETIKKEIEKCDIRCANCHRRKTAKQFGWYKETPSSYSGNTLVL